jgi:hypothetical protein
VRCVGVFGLLFQKPIGAAMGVSWNYIDVRRGLVLF